MGNPLCHHSVVGTLLIHGGMIAVGMRQKPPLKLAPSAGHVDPEDGLIVPGMLVRVAMNEEVYRATAARELAEECGVKVDPDDLIHLLTWRASDTCHKPGFDEEPGGSHIWRIFAVEIGTISRPTLTPEPGGMADWHWRSVGSLLDDLELEPIWFELLKKVLMIPAGQRLLKV